MPQEKHSPATEAEWLALRAQDITSTEIAALFGCSPWTTAFELWHAKKSNTYTSLNPNERMKWGTRLQDSIAAGVAEEQGWTLKKLDKFLYIRNPDARIGSSFDFSFEDGKGGRGLLEIKNVDTMAFLSGWVEVDDNLEAPLHVEFQVQHQMLVSGHKQAYIGALVGGNRLVLIRREPDPSVHKAILTKSEEFWESIRANMPPVPDFARDAEFIAKLYGFAEPNKVMSAGTNPRIAELAVSYKAAAEVIAKAEMEKDAAKAELLTLIGDSEKVLGEGFSISAGVVGPAHIEFDRKGYRNFRINWKKVKG